MDTNALIWFMNGDWMEPASLQAIAEAQAVNGIYVSPVSAWEAAVALQKSNPVGRPHLGGRAADEWFRAVLKVEGTRLVKVGHRITLEAARVPAVYGRGDPGDCFLIATARFKKVPIVTRDGPMNTLAGNNPSYLQAIRC